MPFLFESHKDLLESMGSCLTNNNELLNLANKYIEYVHKVMKVMEEGSAKQ